MTGPAPARRDILQLSSRQVSRCLDLAESSLLSGVALGFSAAVAIAYSNRFSVACFVFCFVVNVRTIWSLIETARDIDAEAQP